MNHIGCDGIFKKVNDLGKGLGIPEPQIQKISRSTLTNEDCLHKLITIWLKTDGIPASWRLLIWKLDWIEEISVADRLKSFSEPLKGMVSLISECTLLYAVCFTSGFGSRGDKCRVLEFWGEGGGEEQ